MKKIIFKYAVLLIIGCLFSFLAFAEYALSSLGMYAGYRDLYGTLTFLVFATIAITNIYLIFFWKKGMGRTIIMQVLSMVFISLFDILSYMMIEGVAAGYYDGIAICITLFVQILSVYGMYKTVTFKKRT